MAVIFILGCVVSVLVTANLVLLSLWRGEVYAHAMTRIDRDAEKAFRQHAEHNRDVMSNQYSVASHSNATSMRERDEAKAALAEAERKLHETEKRLEYAENLRAAEKSRGDNLFQSRNDCQQKLEAIEMVLAGQLSVDDADDDDY